MADNESISFKAAFGIQEDGKVVWIGPPKKTMEVEPLQQHLHSLLHRHGGDVTDENELNNLTENIVFLIRHKIGFDIDPQNLSILRTDIYNPDRGWVAGHKIAVVWYAEGGLVQVIATAKGNDSKRLLAKLKPVVDKMVNDIVYVDNETDEIPFKTEK